MKEVFADACYWIAVVSPQDQWASAAEAAKEALGSVRLVTTDEALGEVLASLCSRGAKVRKAAARAVRAILADPNVDVAPQSRETFLNGLQLYEQRSDKEYSLVDCITMCVMRAKGITEVLTSDDHFSQEGLQALMRAHH